jgi:hypothetical protein
MQALDQQYTRSEVALVRYCEDIGWADLREKEMLVIDSFLLCRKVRNGGRDIFALEALNAAKIALAEKLGISLAIFAYSIW